MDKSDKNILRDIYVKYGADVALNPKKLRAYLLDMRVSKKTINLLTDISRIEYFNSFQEEIKHDPTAREKLIYNTENEYAFDKKAIEYGTDCWVYALTGADASGSGGSTEQKERAEQSDMSEKPEEFWPDEQAELVAAALRELMRSGN